jgi:hypothetical protein
MIQLCKQFYFLVLILWFSYVLGTRRDPSAFEYSSTAPAVLSAPAFLLEHEESKAISALLSTTQLGLQRSEGTVDTYVSGTLLERLYKQAQLNVDVDDNVDSCHKLTT